MKIQFTISTRVLISVAILVIVPALLLTVHSLKPKPRIWGHPMRNRYEVYQAIDGMQDKGVLLVGATIWSDHQYREHSVKFTLPDGTYWVARFIQGDPADTWVLVGGPDQDEREVPLRQVRDSPVQGERLLDLKNDRWEIPIDSNDLKVNK
jgi:hypothetical protein